MSLWRVKHTEATQSPAVALPQAVSLDTDNWTRYDDVAYGYAFAAPLAWTVDVSDPASVRIGRSAKERWLAPNEGAGIQIQAAMLGPRQQIENVAAADFAGMRPALYDVSVDGRPALFAVAFKDARIVRQAVYIPQGDVALVVRAAATDPAVFAAFVSTVKFYATETPKNQP